MGDRPQKRREREGEREREREREREGGSEVNFLERDEVSKRELERAMKEHVVNAYLFNLILF